jgi:hypothetical protein
MFSLKSVSCFFISNQFIRYFFFLEKDCHYRELESSSKFFDLFIFLFHFFVDEFVTVVIGPDKYRREML